jgi:L-rhamnose mutarotase
MGVKGSFSISMGTRGETRVQRICFLLKVRADRVDEYRRRHAAVWPEMLAALRETGWRNYSLFLRPDGLLVGYVETEDFERARAAMQKYPVNGRWQAEMAPFFEALDAGAADASMTPLAEVFHLD